MSRPQIKRLFGPPPPTKGLNVLSTARNELYFWPHFAQHYRDLGATHFIVLDDGSDDGSLEWLKSQPDVTVYQGSIGFADMIGNLRFGIAARGLLAQHFCPNRWALIADLDEFWVPPPGFPTFTTFIAELESKGRLLCRGLMLDCFPTKLADLRTLPPNVHPQQAAPWYDDIGPVIWPAHSPRMDSAQIKENVRMRIVKTLTERGLFSTHDRVKRGSPTLYKAPLAKWISSLRMHSAHILDAPYHGDHQMVCAHYKFTPSWEDKVALALATGNYYKQSIEYQMLAVARDQLPEFDLRGPATKAYSLSNVTGSMLY